MPVVGLNDMKEENDDDERQAYYAGGNTNAGGGRCAARRPYGSTSELPGPLKPTAPLAAPWAQLWPGCVAAGQQITRHTVWPCDRAVPSHACGCVATRDTCQP